MTQRDWKEGREEAMDLLNAILGYSAFLAGFEFIGLSDLDASQSTEEEWAVFIMLVGLCVSIFSVLVSVTLLSFVSPCEECNPLWDSRGKVKWLWLQIPLLSSALSVTLLTVALNVLIHATLPSKTMAIFLNVFTAIIFLVLVVFYGYFKMNLYTDRLPFRE